MTTIFGRFLPTKSSTSDDDEEYNMEYSFAMEYTGPPVGYDIPRVIPVGVGCTPVAAVESTDSLLNKFVLPVIQPIVKTDKKLSKFGSQEVASPILRTHSDEIDSGGVDCMVDSRGKSFTAVNVIDGSGQLCFSDSDECLARVSNGNRSSGRSGFSDSRDNSHELSESSDMSGLFDGRGKTVDDFGHSEIVACEEEEERVHVTFHDRELRYYEEKDCDEMIIGRERQVAKSNLKKGLCHRCLKGNRFTEKEVCIVCNAKYCCNCVLRAMGSMPEGRKCITCITYRIDESKRRTLGKCSRMLKHLLTDSGAKQIMDNEVSCEANQVPPDLVFVNGKRLSREELARLRFCPNPPKKIKPGKYWYDKVSGLWGKEGEKPCQIISPELAVGDPIMQNASNGNTEVMVNNREITKPEVWMLQFAGVDCEGHPHFWLNADGSIQEEGQKNIVERIWFKPGVKLVCAALSLPIVSESAKPNTEEIDCAADKVVLDSNEQDSPYKFLMVGYDQSETNTIFKQAKFLYNVPFSEDERQSIKVMIQSNLYSYIAILLEERERFEEESLNEMQMKSINQPGPSDTLNSVQIRTENIYSISPRLKTFSDWLLQVKMSGNLDLIFPAATREYSPLVEQLWKDRAFQATYNRRNEIQMLPGVSNYFLDKAVEISRTNYEPSDMDILYAEGINSSNGVSSLDFSFTKSIKEHSFYPTDQNDPVQRCQLIMVPSCSNGENCKWLPMFEDVDLVIFCASLTDYDQFSYDLNTGVSANKMLETKKLFETIVTHKALAQKAFLLILTEFHLLEDKIESVPLTHCDWFHDYNPVVHVDENNSSDKKVNAKLAQRAFNYIGDKFKRLFSSLTGNKLYVSRVNCLNADSVDQALIYGKEVLRWDFERHNMNANEWSLTLGSIEPSTTS